MPLLSLWVCVACSRTIFTFTLYCVVINPCITAEFRSSEGVSDELHSRPHPILGTSLHHPNSVRFDALVFLF